MKDRKLLAHRILLGGYGGDWFRFERHQAFSQRIPTYSVFVEKFGDISDSVKSIDCGAEIEDSLHQPNYGHGNIVVQDTDGSFIESGRSLIERNDKIQIWAGFNNDNIPIWKGIVDQASVNTNSHELNLSLTQSGKILEQASTSGDYSAYNTPKLLIDYLCQNVDMPAPSFENDTGVPSTVVFGNTFLANNRNYWTLVHGACLNILYVPFFDYNGVLNLKRRTGFTDIEFCFDDANTISIEYVQDADLINEKHIDYGNPIRFEFTFGDAPYFNQSSRVGSNDYSMAQWGRNTDWETDELIGTWTRAGKIVNEVLDSYPYRKSIYMASAPGVPQLDLLDRISVNSEKRNIIGKFVIIGVFHTITPGSYITRHKILSAGERF